MSTDIHLVETSRHGKTYWSMIFGPKPRFDRNLDTILRTVELTKEEGSLSMEQAVALFKAGQLTAQKAVAPAPETKQGALL
jgi:hypothetical protein